MGFFNPALYWLIIGVMLFMLDLAVPGVLLSFFGLGAIITALVAWLLPVSIAWQLVLFITVSLVSLLTLRDIIQKKIQKSDEPDEGEEVNTICAVPGERAVVTMTITPPAEGKIKYSGTFWRANADEEIGEGEIVTVLGQKDLVVHVEKV